MKFEEKLVTLRKKKGLSQEQLANELDVSRQAVSRWELGTTMPDAPNLVKLSQIFEVSTDYLLHENYDSDEDLPKVKASHQLIQQKNQKDAKTHFTIGCIWTFSAICFTLAAAINPNVHPLVYLNIVMSIVIACRHFTQYRKIKDS